MEFADECGFESRPRNQPPEAGLDRYHIVSPADLQDVARRLAGAGTSSGTSASEKLASRPLTSQNTSTRL
jgi:hypothetical protein